MDEEPRPYVTAVDLEKEHILQVSVPLLRDEKIQQEINETVLEENRKRT